MDTIDIRLRIPKETKIDAEAIFKQMGMTTSEAMRIFLNQCINSGGLPFKPHSKFPNAETRKVLEESAKGIGVTSYVSVEDMFTELYRELDDEGFKVEKHA